MKNTKLQVTNEKLYSIDFRTHHFIFFLIWSFYQFFKKFLEKLVWSLNREDQIFQSRIESWIEFWRLKYREKRLFKTQVRRRMLQDTSSLSKSLMAAQILHKLCKLKTLFSLWWKSKQMDKTKRLSY